MEKINFTNSKTIINKYGGADNKITISYNNKLYMLKKPNVAKGNIEASYINNIFSEYIGCHIFNSIGIKAQTTLLGTYEENGKIKIVCACEDFTEGGTWRLAEFQNLKNSFPETSGTSNGTSTSLEEILEVLDNHNDIKDKEELKEFFWNIFIVDSLIGNFDRHNGNWGILVNDKTNEVKLAPVYDCGATLFAQLTDEQMKLIINNKGEINNRVYNSPTSALTINNKRINYYNFISSLENEDCNKALKNIYPRIDMDKINSIIDSIDYISNDRKNFYKIILSARYKKIIEVSYYKLLKREETANEDFNTEEDEEEI